MHSRGYVDLQVNGYAGVDCNADVLDTDSLSAMCRALRADGIEGILATIITDRMESMMRRLQAWKTLLESDADLRAIIWGIHLEGPFLSPLPGYAGVHPVQSLCAADLDTMKWLLDAAGGLIRLVTLAPELDPALRVTRHLVDEGVRVAAGHCNPSLDELRAAIDAGLTLFTHLGNGCPRQMDRHDNIIQRVLSLSDQLWISWIADGVHIPYPALGNYLRCAGIDRSIIVTDATAAAGMGPGTYRLGSLSIVVDAARTARADATGALFAGSATTMPQMVAGLRQALNLSDESLRQLTSINPRKFLSLT